MALDSARGRSAKRELIDLRDERQAGGSLSASNSTPYDQDIELASLEEDERDVRMDNAHVERYSILARIDATLAYRMSIFAIVVSVVGVLLQVALQVWWPK